MCRRLRTCLARAVVPRGDVDPVIAKLELAPGDCLVVFAKDMLTKEHHEKIKALLEGVIPDHKVLVFDDGLRLGVIKQTGG